MYIYTLYIYIYVCIYIYIIFRSIIIHSLLSNLNMNFSCLPIILNNAFLHLRDCIARAFILLTSSIAFLLKSLQRRELQTILRNIRHANNKKEKHHAYQKVYKQILHLLQ